jgi:hypothetical protein
MRSTKLALLALLALACGKQEQTPEAAPAEMAPAAPAFSLADAAGKWTYVAKTMTGDTVLVTAELTASADPAAWTMLLPDRPVMPVSVTVSGDSVMTAVAEYESVLRKGVKVTTNGVLRMVDGKLVGTMVAHYSNTPTADSVRNLMIEATRKP